MNIKDQLEVALSDSSKPWTSVLENLEVKTGINRLYIFISIIASLGLWLTFGFAGQLVCNFVTFIYPAYVSIHAIESPAKDDDTKWLTYWVVFSIFSLLEYFSDTIVGWFPLYWLAKCVFFIWLMIPTEFNGSIVLYKKVVKPYFLKHHATIDDTAQKIKASAAKLLEKEH